MSGKDEAAAVVSEQNYNSAAMDFIESEGFLDESGEPQSTEPEAVAVEEDVPEAEQEAASDEIASEEETEEEELETYEFEANGKLYNLTMDEMKDMAVNGLTFEDERASYDAEMQETLTEIEEFVGQHQNDLSRLQLIDAAYEQLKIQDPDLALELENAIKMAAPKHDPRVQQLEKKISELERQTKNQNTDAEDRTIRNEWTKGLSDTQKAYDAKFKAAGLKIDWNGRVKDSWVNSGVETVEDALFATYGRQIVKLNESKKSVSNVAKRAASAKAKPLGAKAKGSPGDKKVNITDLSYRDIEEGIASGKLDF